MTRFVYYLWRRLHRPASQSGCPHCQATLVVCPSCQGAWRTPCRTCAVGLLCPNHERHWPA